MSLAGWVNSLSHPPTRSLKKKKHSPTPTHSITSETMTTFANKMGCRLFESIWGRKKNKKETGITLLTSTVHPSLISKLQNAHAFDGYQHAYSISDLMNI